MKKADELRLHYQRVFSTEQGKAVLDDLERIASNFGPENIAACIVEPIGGSAGVLVPPKGYLQRLKKICDKHGILLIFDEVITGWGRTGSVFAAQEFGVTPDIITMAKATTNGVVPMGVVACREKIYDTIVDAAPDGAIELFHGYTYSGIPAAVAVATEANQIAASSFSGVLAHLKRRSVDFKMGNILVVGGLLGSGVGVEIFRIIKSYGQTDLFVSLCYIVFLGSIGTLMFIESLSTIQRSRKPQRNFKHRKKHNWIHGLPFKTKFKSSKLYISAIPPIVIGFFIGILASIMGVGGGFILIPANA